MPNTNLAGDELGKQRIPYLRKAFDIALILPNQTEQRLY
jgi:hypothetical protein